jgi:MFS family permease
MRAALRILIPMIFSLFSISLFVVSLPIGLLPTLLDGMKRSWRDRLKISDASAEWPLRWFYFSWLPGMPCAGWALDEWTANTKEIFFFALVALILGIAWLALVRSLPLLVCNAVLLGFAYSVVATTALRLMPTAFFVAENELFASLQVGFVAVGVGALIGPWIVHAIDQWAGYRQGLLYLSTAMIVPAALIAQCNREPFSATQQPILVGWEDILTHSHIGLIVGVILVFFAIENCLDIWPESYLRELGYQGRGVPLAMTIFWLAFIATRGAAAWWLYHHPTHGVGLTLFLVILASLIIGNLASGYEIGSGTVGFWLLGACYGPLLPCLLGIALTLYEAPLPASAQGALLALSGLDTLLVRPLLRAFENGRPARIVMRVPTVLAMLMAAPLVLLLFLRRG